ncbi:MAG: enoyl-CoA hydratase/isomerase family protein [Candidatus Thorarchaeota archaeon]|nr:enoyl-CoA hydratase/isomerase family protein [Candidatus Thorarchaeota archaeon]
MKGGIKLSKDGEIAIVTISRPNKLNSVTEEMLVSFDEHVNLLTSDPETAIIVFTGEGEKAFSSGFDLDTIRGLKGQKHFDFFKLLQKAILRIREANTCITIAALNGYAIGFGAMVASACDFRFFAENATFRLPEVALKVFPGMGAASNLLHLVGPARAKDILLTTRTVSAEEALRIGLADRVFPPEELMDRTMEFVKGLLEMDRKILLRTKTLVDVMTGETVPGAHEMEAVYAEEWLNEVLDEE